MAPRRKPKSVNKRFISEGYREIDVGSSTTTKQLEKLTKKLGPQWTRVELERFYDAYRKHPGDWKKVAAAVRNNRSVDMVKALFKSNRAYLSLPEGTASVAGFVAMMTDHYVERSESEGEGRDTSGVPGKHQKRRRAKVPHSAFGEEAIPSQSVVSAEGCLSFLRQTRAYGIERRACGIRNPRIPIPRISERDDREASTPPIKRAKKQWDNDVLHVVELALADESRRGRGSPYRGTELNDSTQVRLGKMSKEGVSTMGLPQKGKIVRVEEAEGDDSDDNRELYNPSEEFRTKPGKGMVYVEATREEFEALEALTELSASLHRAGLMESEQSAQLKEDKIPNNVDEESNTPETIFSSLHREKAKQAISATDNRKPTSVKESVDGNAVSGGEYGTSRRKRKPKALGVETLKDSIQDKSLCSKELAEDENLKSLVKARRAGQGPAKLLEMAKISEEPSITGDKKRTGQDALVSATQVSGPGPASLSQKPPNRRKMSLKKSLQERAKSSETTRDKPRSYRIYSEHELLKEKVSTCLSHTLVRQRCIYEWFYSAIDYPWFAKTEFTDYVNHVGLGHIQRLTRPEWSVIRSSLGRPKRFSERFIQKERDKLEQYRESVRKHYAELRAGAKEGLPTDFAQPLSVGNRVIAIHPKTREIHDGKILTVDHKMCKVLFDELGVELVMDTDCMPLNLLEYMPEGLRRQMDKCLCMNNEAQLNRHPKSDASLLFGPSVLDNVKFSMTPPVKQGNINGPILNGQVLATNTADQYITTNSKEMGTEIQRALMLQHTWDVEMEPEMIEIFSGSKSKAQAMLDAIMKAAFPVKKEEDAGKRVQQSLSLNGGGHQPLYNNSIGPTGFKHQSRTPTNTAELMTSELITSCVATWQMIQMCTEKQYPPGEVAQLMEKAVSGLRPRCSRNMPIYREIQTFMGYIKTRIMALVRT